MSNIIFNPLTNKFDFIGDSSVNSDRLDIIENTQFKIAYYAEITTTTGSITIPTGATVLLDQWPNGQDAVLSKIVGGKPDYNDTGVNVTTFDSVGNYVLDGSLPSNPTALIYYFLIKQVDLIDLDSEFVIEQVELKSHSELEDLTNDDHLQYLLLAGRGGQEIRDSLKIGDIDNGNFFEIESDGTTAKRGEATVWDDVVNSLIGRRLYSNQGTIDYDYNENAILFSDDGNISNINDRVVFNLQYPHGAIANGTMNLHIHWTQEDTTDIGFTIQYRIQSNGNAKTTTWTTVTSSSLTDSVFTYTSGILNQITNLAVIDMTGAGISATVQFRMTRSDSNGGTIMGTFVDAHVERDTEGSRQEFVK